MHTPDHPSVLDSMPTPAEAEAMLNIALGAYLDGRPFSIADLSAVREATGRTRWWIRRVLTDRVTTGLLTRETTDPADPSDLVVYRVIDPGQLHAAITAAAAFDLTRYHGFDTLTRADQDKPDTPKEAADTEAVDDVEAPLATMAPIRLSRDDEAAAALARLSTLAITLGHTAGLPALMLMLTTDEALGSLVSSRRDDCQPVPILTLDTHLLYADPTDHNGRVAAGAMAHAIACAARPVSAAMRRSGRIAAGAALILVIAVTASWAALMAAALTVVALSAYNYASSSRREEYAADADAVQLLDATGHDGRACLEAMLTHQLTKQLITQAGRPRIPTWDELLTMYGLACVPADIQRIQALSSPPRYLNWSAVGTCAITGHHVWTSAHRTAHAARGRRRCRPTSWHLLPPLRGLQD
ncbi:hypothetical protein ACFV1N_46095 [Streptosporangium canum]|uniref:hypothetical protein n=1 Tax=Streptosporangium canum TaxID=324952 RepID=UPI003689A2C0